MKEKLNFLELFAGAGGLSEGFVQNGFEPVAYVEQDKDCCSTLLTRSIYHYLLKNNLKDSYNEYLKGNLDRNKLFEMCPNTLKDKILCKQISSQTLPNLITTIELLLNGKTLDVLIGGPPCQAYSLIGRAQNKQKINDERLYLYKHYLEILTHFKPTVFVFENVPGLLSMSSGDLFKTIINDFKQIGYEVDYEILNSAEYGVLQSRKRVIVIGALNKKVTLELPKIDISMYRVKDIFEDLNALMPGQSSDKYSLQPNEYLKTFNIRNDDEILTHHEARPNNDRDLNIYKYAIQTWNNEKKRIKYHEIPDYLQSHNNKSSFLDRYKVVADDLNASHTMVAHISKDGHHYIHPDIKQCRSISVREAARIQSFPDDYYFEGSRTSKFKQIGNAVPPLLSKTIANKIKDII